MTLDDLRPPDDLADVPPATRTPKDSPASPSDGATAEPGASAAGSAKDSAAKSAKESTGPGLRSRFRATRTSAFRLATAHIDLARAELAEIVAQAKRVALLLATALGLVLFGTLVLVVGTSLFLGEWLFGSIGWGVLLGAELSLTGALVAVLVAVGIPASGLVRRLGPSVVIGLVVAVLAGLSLPNRLWDGLGAAAAPGLLPSSRPLVVGIAVGAVVGFLIGAVGALRGDRDPDEGGAGVGSRLVGAVGRGLASAVPGALLGALSAVSFSWRVAAALGTATAIGAWAAMSALLAYRIGIDPETFLRRFYPAQTIAATKETIEWVRERTPLGPKS